MLHSVELSLEKVKQEKGHRWAFIGFSVGLSKIVAVTFPVCKKEYPHVLDFEIECPQGKFPDGTKCCSRGSSIVVWDAGARACLCAPASDGSACAHRSPCATDTLEHVGSVLTYQYSESDGTEIGDKDTVRSVALSNDGYRLAIGSTEFSPELGRKVGRIRVWDVGQPQHVPRSATRAPRLHTSPQQIRSHSSPKPTRTTIAPMSTITRCLCRNAGWCPCSSLMMVARSSAETLESQISPQLFFSDASRRPNVFCEPLHGDPIFSVKFK